MPEFRAKQDLKMKVPDESRPIEDYLKEPSWLVAAITEADRVETLGDNHFRLKLRQKKFMQLQFEPQADLKVHTDDDGTLHIRSTGYRIEGLESLQESLGMALSGELTPLRRGHKTWLEGTARIWVSFDLPPVLRMIPKAVLKPAGNAFLGSILATMKGRVRQQLVEDYRRWVAEHQTPQTPATPPQR